MNILITGGLGFIGSSIAKKWSKQAKFGKIILIDNIIRHGSETRVEQLSTLNRVEIIRASVSNRDWFSSIDCQIDVVIHCAAQVAVTTSLTDPWLDFNTNATGTLSVLEFVRLNAIKYGHNPLFFYSSTNKIYGDLSDEEIELTDIGYRFTKKRKGIREDQKASPVTPYGTSKYCGELLVQEYAASFGIRTVVFRKSCIFGAYQTGIIDQGWISFMTQNAFKTGHLDFFGDGHQSRDVLVVEDLVECYETVIKASQTGQLSVYEVFNIGGGVDQVYSLRGITKILELELGITVSTSIKPWRPNDQKVYISDTTKIKSLGWSPKHTVTHEISILADMLA